MRYFSSTAGQMTLQVSINSTVTAVQVDSVVGLPTQYPYTLALDYGLGSEELVDVTSAAGVNLTVTRGVDSTIAQDHDAGAEIRHVFSGRDANEEQQHIAAANGVHGVTGDVVGTDDVQTLDNKTFYATGTDHPALVVKGSTGGSGDYATFSTDGGGRVAGATPSGFSIGTEGEAVSTVEMRTTPAANFWGSVITVAPRASGPNGIYVALTAGATGKSFASSTDGVEKFKVTAAGAAVLSGTVTATGVVSSGPVSGTTGTFTGQVKSNGVNTVTLTETQTLTNKTLTSPATTGLTGDTAAFTGAVTAPNLPAVPAAKAGKKFTWLTTTVNTDSGAFASITHGLGATPTVVTATVAADVGTLYPQVLWSTPTPTTVRIRILDRYGEGAFSVVGIPVSLFVAE